MGLFTSLTPAARREAKAQEAARRAAAQRRQVLQRLQPTPSYRSIGPRLLAGSHEPLTKLELMQRQAWILLETPANHGLQAGANGRVFLEELARLGGGDYTAQQLLNLNEDLWPRGDVLADAALNEQECHRVKAVALELLGAVKQLRGLDWQFQLGRDEVTFSEAGKPIMRIQNQPDLRPQLSAPNQEPLLPDVSSLLQPPGPEH